MYRFSPPASPNTLRAVEICCVRFESSTKLSGHKDFFSSSFVSRRPLLSTKSNKRAYVFRVRGTGIPSQDGKPCEVSSTNDPNSYKCPDFNCMNLFLGILEIF